MKLLSTILLVFITYTLRAQSDTVVKKNVSYICFTRGDSVGVDSMLKGPFTEYLNHKLIPGFIIKYIKDTTKRPFKMYKKGYLIKKSIRKLPREPDRFFGFLAQSDRYIILNYTKDIGYSHSQKNAIFCVKNNKVEGFIFIEMPFVSTVKEIQQLFLKREYELVNDINF